MEIFATVLQWLSIGGLVGIIVIGVLDVLITGGGEQSEKQNRLFLEDMLERASSIRINRLMNFSNASDREYFKEKEEEEKRKYKRPE